MNLETYKEIEQTLFKEIARNFKEELHLYCVTGGFGRNEIIPGWSDIDVTIVVSEYSPRIFDSLWKIQEELNSSIKIGISLFSLEDFNLPEAKGVRTFLAINDMAAGVLIPDYMSSKIILNSSSREKILALQEAELARAIHDLKRFIFNLEPENEIKAYKLCVVIFKIYLYKKGVLARGYSETLEQLRLMDALPFNFFSPVQVLSEPQKISERRANYIRVIQWAVKNLKHD